MHEFNGESKLLKIVKITLALLLLIGVSTQALLINKVKAVESLPTVWVKVYRIQAIDSIEGIFEDGADWRFKVQVSDGETTTTKEFKCPSNDDDIVVNHVDSFTDLKHSYVSITIMLFEDDLFGDETADISSAGDYFDCTYYLKTNNFVGDVTIVEGGYNKTSGDYDGSVTTDENDANLWFYIWDNYDAPIANAGEDKQCYTGEKVNFDGSGSTASGGSSIVKYEWDFENDEIIDAEGAKTSFTYQQKGVHFCRLKVTDSIGEWSEDTCVINVMNKPPVAEFVYSPLNPTIQDAINFVDQSSDPDGYITSWLWDFGDGISTSLQNPTHTFSQKGNHDVILMVTDSDGAQKSITYTIVVLNLPPVACFNCTTASPRTTDDVQFTDESTDPENIPFQAYLWDFGDGYTSDLQNPTHKFASKGNYNVTLTVWDDENANSTYSMIISVSEPPPSEVPISFPLWVIALVVVAILAIGVSALYVRRRHKTAAI